MNNSVIRCYYNLVTKIMLSRVTVIYHMRSKQLVKHLAMTLCICVSSILHKLQGCWYRHYVGSFYVQSCVPQKFHSVRNAFQGWATFDVKMIVR